MKSPCKRICKVKDDICIGCQRTLSEIKNWSIMSDEERDVIMLNIKQRTKNNTTSNGL